MNQQQFDKQQAIASAKQALNGYLHQKALLQTKMHNDQVIQAMQECRSYADKFLQALLPYVDEIFQVLEPIQESKLPDLTTVVVTLQGQAVVLNHAIASACSNFSKARMNDSFAELTYICEAPRDRAIVEVLESIDIDTLESLDVKILSVAFEYQATVEIVQR